MNGDVIEAHPDCEHADFDVMGQCVRCARDFSAERDAGLHSEAEMDRELARMQAAMQEFPDEFPTCVVVGNARVILDGSKA